MSVLVPLEISFCRAWYGNNFKEMLYAITSLIRQISDVSLSCACFSYHTPQNGSDASQLRRENLQTCATSATNYRKNRCPQNSNGIESACLATRSAIWATQRNMSAHSQNDNTMRSGKFVVVFDCWVESSVNLGTEGHKAVPGQPSCWTKQNEHLSLKSNIELRHLYYQFWGSVLLRCTSTDEEAHCVGGASRKEWCVYV